METVTQQMYSVALTVSRKATSWNLMEYHGTSWNLIESHRISCNLMESHRIAEGDELERDGDAPAEGEVEVRSERRHAMAAREAIGSD